MGKKKLVSEPVLNNHAPKKAQLYSNPHKIYNRDYVVFFFFLIIKCYLLFLGCIPFLSYFLPLRKGPYTYLYSSPSW